MKFLKDLFGPPSPQRFAELTIEGLRKRGERGALQFDEAAFTIHTQEPMHSLFLGNFYQSYCGAPKSEREAVIDAMAENWSRPLREMPASFEEARPLLIPTVRSLAYYEFSNLRLELRDIPATIRPLTTIGSNLGVSLVLDYPETARHLPNEKLDEWSVTLEEAMTVARANLAERSTAGLLQLMPGLVATTWEDTYDGSRLLLPELFTSFGFSQTVALAPHRNRLLVADGSNGAALALMSTTAASEKDEPHPLSSWPLVLSDAGWIDYPRDSRFASFFRPAALQQRNGDYQGQHELLAALYPKRGIDAYISKFYATQHQTTKELSSFCTWSEGGTQLLPEADRVAFSAASTKGMSVLGFARWETVRAVAGTLMVATDHYPPRWRVDGFPSREQLARMELGED